MATNAEVKRLNEAHASMADAERQGSATNPSQNFTKGDMRMHMTRAIHRT